MVNVIQLDSAAAAEALPQLVDLLINSVENGASIGFVWPITPDIARQYWQGRIEAVRSGTTMLLAALEGERIVGVVLLALEPRANGSHRAEVQKLMVHTAYRRCGIGRRLMEALETTAHQHQRTLLVLDTRGGDPSNALYLSMGYIHAGTIPQYARSPDGSTLDETRLYYKILE